MPGRYGQERQREDLPAFWSGGAGLAVSTNQSLRTAPGGKGLGKGAPPAVGKSYTPSDARYTYGLPANILPKSKGPGDPLDQWRDHDKPGVRVAGKPSPEASVLARVPVVVIVLMFLVVGSVVLGGAYLVVHPMASGRPETTAFEYVRQMIPKYWLPRSIEPVGVNTTASEEHPAASDVHKQSTLRPESDGHDGPPAAPAAGDEEMARKVDVPKRVRPRSEGKDFDDFDAGDRRPRREYLMESDEKRTSTLVRRAKVDRNVDVAGLLQTEEKSTAVAAEVSREWIRKAEAVKQRLEVQGARIDADIAADAEQNKTAANHAAVLVDIL